MYKHTTNNSNKTYDSMDIFLNKGCAPGQCAGAAWSPASRGIPRSYAGAAAGATRPGCWSSAPPGSTQNPHHILIGLLPDWEQFVKKADRSDVAEPLRIGIKNHGPDRRSAPGYIYIYNPHARRYFLLWDYSNSNKRVKAKCGNVCPSSPILCTGTLLILNVRPLLWDIEIKI